MAFHRSSSTRRLLDRYFAFLQRRGKSDRIILHVVLGVVLATGLFALLSLNTSVLTSVPTPGGVLVEGIVGTPRFVNPVLAITRADHDMVALVYSGLMKMDENGKLVNDIAQSIELSEDGRTYHIILKEGVRFHDGSELTVRDVSYTIALIQNAELKSPLRGNWDGVLVEELGEYEMNIVLEEAYPPFIENLTVGILPRDIWDELPTEQLPFSQNNTEPVGSGPYKVAEVLRTRSGLIQAYRLEPFSDAGMKPNISTLVFQFYQNEDEIIQALNSGDIAGTPSLSAENLARVDTDNYQIIETPLPRTFALYFNQNRSAALRDRSARKALSVAVDRQALVEQVLFGHGIPSNSPIPPGFVEAENPLSTTTPSLSSGLTPVQQAEQILIDGGWERTSDGTWEKEVGEESVALSVSISTVNTPLFDQTATYVSDVWRSLGVEVSVSQFEQADLVQGIIRPRNFEALLFGADIGRQIDLYPFWHSSQKNDPGLNIAQYTNIDVDEYLERLRTTTDQEVRLDSLRGINRILQEELPAVFLFVPTFTYILDDDVKAAAFSRITKPSERFANIAQWHIQSDKLWPIFSNTNN